MYSTNIVKGYKGFEKKDGKIMCRDYEYVVDGSWNVHNGDVQLCKSGFHYCKQAVDCNTYYPHTSTTRYAEIRVLGKEITCGDKSCTDKIEIVREISTLEWEKMINGIADIKGNRYWYKNGQLADNHLKYCI